MYTRSAAFYDALYAQKDYAREAQIVHARIEEYCRSGGAALLDVACGTGHHLSFLRQYYTAQGMDISPDLLIVARQRCPDVTFYEGDMTRFDLGFQVDAVTCLFSSIGYVKTVERLGQAVRCMARHVKPGGVLLVEPWFAPDRWYPGTLHATYVDQPDLKIARMTISDLDDRVSVNEMHYLVATPQGIDYFTERHELGLFVHQEYLDAFRAAGLDVVYDPDGLTGRGLYIGLSLEQD